MFIQRMSFLFAGICLVWLAGSSAALGHASKHSGSAGKTVGDYTIAVKLLPAEKFVDPAEANNADKAGEMVNGDGTDPVEKSGDADPNHHLVAFIKKDGKPVTDADVRMRYHKTGQSDTQPTQLPVTKMWVAGKGEKTTHYGNNVAMQPGKYEVHLTVNDNAEADFEITAQ